MRVAIVCGGAEGVWDEAERALELVGDSADVVRIAVNDAGTIHPDPLHHWCTLHPEKLGRWRASRRANGLGEDFTVWGVTRAPEIDQITRAWRNGSSGLLAVEVAVQRLDADATILCGVPMDERPNAFRGQPWGQCRRYRAGWTHRGTLREMQGRVKSWSGWTRDLLGEPTEAWLESICAEPADASRS